jgi:predicted DNA-binding transcriptional regulator AlpA
MLSPKDRVLSSIADRIEGRNTSSHPLRSTELWDIDEVEKRTKMKSSNIYRLIQLGQFPAPIHLGGAKWIAAEVEEYIQRCADERDRELGGNKFVPRPSILSGNLPGGQDEASMQCSADGRPPHAWTAAVSMPCRTCAPSGAVCVIRGLSWVSGSKQ